jgi:hypothetical protein
MEPQQSIPHQIVFLAPQIRVSGQAKRFASAGARNFSAPTANPANQSAPRFAKRQRASPRPTVRHGTFTTNSTPALATACRSPTNSRRRGCKFPATRTLPKGIAKACRPACDMAACLRSRRRDRMHSSSSSGANSSNFRSRNRSAPQNKKPREKSILTGLRREASVGVEPTLSDFQSDA